MEHLSFARSSLVAGRDALLALLESVEGEAVRWRPGPGKWSMLEIANHLADEEREDFRARLRSTLEDPAAPWEPIDPEGWVSARRYQEQDMAASIERFAGEREESLRWLAELRDPNWNQSHETSDGGSITAGDLLASWVAHDLFHLRQLVRLKYRYLEQALPGFDPAYAGDWGES